MPTRPGPSNTIHYASPTGGWNALDNLAAMPPTDAVTLINLFPETSYLRLRRGNRLWSQTAATGPVRTLMTYSNAAGQKLLAAAGGHIYDVSTIGGAASIASGFTNDAWQFVNFATPGGQYLVAVNGSDGLQYIYDGTSWTAGADSWDAGIPQVKFSSIANFANRLWFASAQNLWLYWLPVTTFQGAINGMDLGGFLPKGGAIAALGTWTRDNAYSGMTNMLVVLTTRGECIVFQGIDPENVSNWQVVGKFTVGEPVAGHRQLSNIGPDIILLCEDGFQPLATYLSTGQSKALASALSRKIGNAVTKAVKSQKSAFGWEACLYPANNMLLVNVPISGGTVQYVVNTVTGAWCQFQGINAQTWAVYANALYYGNATGGVCQGETGPDDLGNPIQFDLVTAFVVPGGAAQMKRATMCQPYLIANGLVQPVMNVVVNYNPVPITGVIDTTASNALWDTVDWDQFDWGSAGYVQSQWYSVGGMGQAFALRFTGAARATTMQLMAFDLALEAGVNFV